LTGTNTVSFASDTATWVAVDVAIGAASLALLAAVVVLVVILRGRRSSHAAVELLRDSLRRTEEMQGDLASALDDARAETQRAHELGDIAATIDLDAVLSRTLEGQVIAADGLG
jgi:hypothetical protein